MLCFEAKPLGRQLFGALSRKAGGEKFQGVFAAPQDSDVLLWLLHAGRVLVFEGWRWFAGVTHLANTSLDLGSATDQWKVVFAASAAEEEQQQQQEEILNPVIENADAQQTQAALASVHAHHDPASSSASQSQGASSNS